MNKIFCILGPSGVGKTSLAYAIQEVTGARVLSSYTDRPPRSEHEKGHTFVSKAEYDKLSNKVAETLFDNHRYCATAQQIDENDIYVVDIKGIHTLRERYQGKKEIIVIFLEAPASTCIERMLRDGRDERAVSERAAHDLLAFANARELATFTIDASKSREEVLNDALSIINF